MSSKSKLQQRLSLEGEIHKAKKVLLKLINPKIVKSDQAIPLTILQRAKGVAFITVIKAGFIFSGTVGCGLVMAKLDDGTWTGPSSLSVAGMGWGALIGAQVTDTVIVLNTDAAVLAFSGQGQIQFGGNLTVAAGPVGRDADASARLGTNAGMAACYSYSHSRGVFAGISLQGSILVTRDSDNARFYGAPVKAKDILNGYVTPPDFQDLKDVQKLLSTIMTVGNALNRIQDLSQSLRNAQEEMSDDSDYEQGGGEDDNSNLKPMSSVEFGEPTIPITTSSQQSLLPPGWARLQTPEGQFYYYHADSQKTQWEKPQPVVVLPKVATLSPPAPPIRKNSSNATSTTTTTFNSVGSTMVVPPPRTTSLDRKQPPPRTNSLRMQQQQQQQQLNNNNNVTSTTNNNNPFDGF
jgi:lipid-binding SYLF domain-containing protein